MVVSARFPASLESYQRAMVLRRLSIKLFPSGVPVFFYHSSALFQTFLASANRCGLLSGQHKTEHNPSRCGGMILRDVKIAYHVCMCVCVCVTVSAILSIFQKLNAGVPKAAAHARSENAWRFCIAFLSFFPANRARNSTKRQTLCTRFLRRGELNQENGSGQWKRQQ